MMVGVFLFGTAFGILLALIVIETLGKPHA